MANRARTARHREGRAACVPLPRRARLPEPATGELSAKSWKSQDGEIELRYTPRAGDAEDSTGEMVLALPASLLEPGKPATLRVTGSPSGSRRWFGLLPLR